MTPDPSIPPLTMETLKGVAQSIFTPIKRGESVTMVWVPMSGRRKVTKFLIANPSLFPKIIGKPDSYLLAYIEPLDLTEESLRGYLQLVGRSLVEACQKSSSKALKKLGKEQGEGVFSDEAATSTKLLSQLKSFARKAIDLNTKLVFFLGEFDELSFANNLFYNNLKSFWACCQPSLYFVFLVRGDITKYRIIKKFAELVEVILQNVTYVPLLGDADIEYVIDRMEERFDDKFTPKEKQTVKQVCGGHPSLIVTACQVLAKMENRAKLKDSKVAEALLGHYRLKLAAREIWEVQNPAEREILRTIVADGVKALPEQGAALEKLGLVKKEKPGELNVFGEVFKNAIVGETEVKTARKGVFQALSLDPNNGAILLGDRPIEEKFTRQEYEVLTFLLTEPNKLRSRDEIGEILWGEDSYEKYSDWAIDQLVSKLRKKLGQLDVGKNVVVTVRGRGYKFVVPRP